MCHKTINIRANGKSTQARVMDECPEGGGNCHYGDLDLSPSLFQFFNSLDVGKFPIEWEFADDGAPAPQPQPTTTYVDPAPYSPPVDIPPVTTVDTTSVDYVPPTTTTSAYVEVESVVPTTTDTTTDTYVPDTTTSTSSAETTTSTPSLGEQLAQAMGAENIYSMGEVFASIGNLMMYPTPSPTTTPAF
jgi:hypothetical protein